MPSQYVKWRLTIIVTDIEIILFNGFIADGGALEAGSLRDLLTQCGLVDAGGRLLDAERLGWLLKLADTPLTERQAALQLPKENPLRLFYENVLKHDDGTTAQILEVVKSHLQRNQGRLPQHSPAASLEHQSSLAPVLHDQFAKIEFSQGELRRPALHHNPERIVWSLRLDLATKLGKFLNSDERRKKDAYRILSEVKGEAGASKLMSLGHTAAGIGAMQSLLAREGCPPPLLPGFLQLHVGKNRLRANLFSRSESDLLKHFTEHFLRAAERMQLSKELRITGPLSGRETFSAACIFTFDASDPTSLVPEMVGFTTDTWSTIKRVLDQLELGSGD